MDTAMMAMLDSIKQKLVTFFKTTDAIMRSRAIETIEYEQEEMENIFAVLIFGAFVGIPSPPIHITMTLLPLVEKELGLMLAKVSTAHDPLGDLFSVLEID
jgi:hypothetical protein